MSSDTLKKRYLFKLISNIIGFFINLIIAGIVPRSLGVKNYGNFNFTTTILTQIITLLDFRTSTCFYTKLSQRQDDSNLIKFYMHFALLLFLILFVVVIVINSTPLHQFVFPGQSSNIIVYALVFVILTWVVDIFIKIMDARGETVLLEKARIINKIVSVILLVLLFIVHYLNLTVYFYYQYLMMVIFIIPLFFYIKRFGFHLSFYPLFESGLLRSYAKEFYIYSAPLGLYVLLSVIQTFFDRWFLQLCGGSFQQGLYSFSFNITYFCFLFTLALIPLFIRELSVAAGEGDIIKSAQLYRRYVPLLYAITAYFCCFIFVEIEPIIKIFGGKEYLNATLAMSILAFYPLVSVYSNLNGAVIYANGKTRIFLKLALIFTPLSIFTTYLLISNGIIGLNLGAAGLAMKNLAFELISVIIILFVNAKFLKINFWNYLFHMFFSILPFIMVAYIAHFFIHWSFGFLPVAFNTFIPFLFSGTLYSVFILFIVWFFPILFGLTRNDITYQITAIRKIFFTK